MNERAESTDMAHMLLRGVLLLAITRAQGREHEKLYCTICICLIIELLAAVVLITEIGRRVAMAKHPRGATAYEQQQGPTRTCWAPHMAGNAIS